MSGGEIYAGLLAGVDPSQMIFHGNNKSRAEPRRRWPPVWDSLPSTTTSRSPSSSPWRKTRVETSRSFCASIPGSMYTPSQDADRCHRLKFGFPVWDGQAEEAASRICRSATRPRRLSRTSGPRSSIPLVARTIDVIMEFAGHMHRRWGAIPNVVIPAAASRCR